jgi:hypothetical protein
MATKVKRQWMAAKTGLNPGVHRRVQPSSTRLMKDANSNDRGNRQAKSHQRGGTAAQSHRQQRRPPQSLKHQPPYARPIRSC